MSVKSRPLRADYSVTFHASVGKPCYSYTNLLIRPESIMSCVPLSAARRIGHTLNLGESASGGTGM